MQFTWIGIRPYLALIFMQFGLAGLAIIAKLAINHGMSHYSLAVYRQAVATILISPFALLLERKVRPKMSFSIFIKILALGLLEPVLDQNLYYAGMQYTSATFVTALGNTVPALTFIMAWIFRLEKVNLKKVDSLAKVGGTIVTIGGASIMTFVKGPIINFPWTHSKSNHVSKTSYQQDPIKGALITISGCLAWAGFVILQAITLKSYPAEMSVTAMMCLAGAVEGLIVALILEPDTSIWALHFDTNLLAYLYSGVICSAIGFFLQGKIMKEKGPVFVTAFNPLNMVIVAFLGCFILADQLSLGRVMGAMVIVTGLYMVIWGKSKEEEKCNTYDESSNQMMQLDLPISNTPTTSIVKPTTLDDGSRESV